MQIKFINRLNFWNAFFKQILEINGNVDAEIQRLFLFLTYLHFKILNLHLPNIYLPCESVSMKK